MIPQRLNCPLHPRKSPVRQLIWSTRLKHLNLPLRLRACGGLQLIFRPILTNLCPLPKFLRRNSPPSDYLTLTLRRAKSNHFLPLLSPRMSPHNQLTQNHCLPNLPKKSRNPDRQKCRRTNERHQDRVISRHSSQTKLRHRFCPPPPPMGFQRDPRRKCGHPPTSLLRPSKWLIPASTSRPLCSHHMPNMNSRRSRRAIPSVLPHRVSKRGLLTPLRRVSTNV